MSSKSLVPNVQKTNDQKKIVSRTFFSQAGVMAKPVLGRDLGRLMGRAPDESGALPAAAQTAPPGAGVRSLMQGQTASALKTRVPRWYLFAGDTLLVALALITVYRGRHPLSLAREIFCVATVLLAALLAIIAILTPEDEARSASGAGTGVMPNGESPKKFGKQKANAPGAKQ